MVPGPTRLCSFKRPGAQCAIRGAQPGMLPGAQRRSWGPAWLTPAESRSRQPDRAPASQVRTPARPRPGLVDQNAGMTEPSDQVDSMYCLT